MQNLTTDFSNPCDNGNLSNSLVLSISTEIGQALSSPCPSASTPSCSIYQPIYSGSSSLVTNIVNNISQSISDPCSASAPSCPDYAPLQTAQSKFTNNLIETIFSSLNSTIGVSPCTLFNSKQITLSGPLSPCVGGTISSQIGDGLQAIIQQSIETLVSSIGSAVQSPCTFLNSDTISLTGPLSSCLDNSVINSNIGKGVRNIVQDGIQTVFTTINTVLTGNTCTLINTANYTLSGPLANCGLSVPSLQSNVASVLSRVIGDVMDTVNQTVTDVLSATPEQILSGHTFPITGPLSSCFSGNILLSNVFKDLLTDTLQTAIDTVSTVLQDPCAAIDLVGPMAGKLNIQLPDIDNLIENILASSCVVDEVIDFVETNQERILIAALATPMTQGSEDAILNLVDYLSCELFEKFIDPSGSTPDACVKNSIFEFVKTESCGIIGKINEHIGTGPNVCQSQFNTLINRILCGYLDDFNNQGLVGGSFNLGTGDGSVSITPKGCVLLSANEIIEEYAPLFYVVINGSATQMKIPTEMKIDFQNATVSPQYYDLQGNKILN